MHRKYRFKIGDRVNGFSFSKKRILGEYRGVRGSFGCWVYGIEVGSFDQPSLHVCQTLSLEKVVDPVEKTKLSMIQDKPKHRDLCTGLTKDDKKSSDSL